MCVYGNLCDIVILSGGEYVCLSLHEYNYEKCYFGLFLNEIFYMNFTKEDLNHVQGRSDGTKEQLEVC